MDKQCSTTLTQSQNHQQNQSTLMIGKFISKAKEKQGRLVAASTISCAFSVRILSLSPPRPGPWINHFHKSYIKYILASHCIKRLHKYRTRFKSKNRRSVVNPFHNAMNLVFILVNASWSLVWRCPRKLSTSLLNIKAGWSL